MTRESRVTGESGESGETVSRVTGESGESGETVLVRLVTLLSLVRLE